MREFVASLVTGLCLFDLQSTEGAMLVAVEIGHVGVWVGRSSVGQSRHGEEDAEGHDPGYSGVESLHFDNLWG